MPMGIKCQGILPQRKTPLRFTTARRCKIGLGNHQSAIRMRQGKQVTLSNRLSQ
ncbi:hypothetical protein D3C80_1794420 [compost metagenome]